MVAKFFVYDIVFLVAFLIFFSLFLYKRRHNLKKEGLLFLYRTSWGIKIINSLGKKHKKTLNVLGYFSILCGYLLMIGAIYLIYTIVKVYLFNPSLVRAIKIPPILPLFPYLPQAFNLDFLPPFYFTYWIVIIAIIAITHEMAHGIFMSKYNIKIKSTGFAFFPYFFPIFPAAFVEQDEKSMNKAKGFRQMVVLSAGTFANILTAVLFFVVLLIFFSFAFSASGVVFDSYATSTIAISGISSVNGININNAPYDEIIELTNEESLSEIKADGRSYLANKKILEEQKDNTGLIFVYNSAPAIKENLSRIILEINGVKIDSLEKLVEELDSYSPGDEIIVKTKTGVGFEERVVTLEEHPERPGTSWLGIGFSSKWGSGILGKVMGKLSSFKQPWIYYEPKFNGISIFIYNLLWWIILISLSVAFVNMLPVGIFDGGRFFYLTVFALTKSEKVAKKAFAFTTYIFLFILLLLMVAWVLRVF